MIENYFKKWTLDILQLVLVQVTARDESYTQRKIFFWELLCWLNEININRNWGLVINLTILHYKNARYAGWLIYLLRHILVYINSFVILIFSRHLWNSCYEHMRTLYFNIPDIRS